MAIIDTYNKSGIAAKIDNNAKTAGFKAKEQQGDPSEFNLTPEFLDKKDLNGNATAPYTPKKTYEDVVPRK
jgi:hypothetical protein